MGLLNKLKESSNADYQLAKKNKCFFVEINGIKYKIEIKTNILMDKIVILIDDNVRIEEKIPCVEYRLFYPIKIDDADVVIELIDAGFHFEKDIYINGISVKTGSHIDDQKNKLKRIVDMGLRKYLTRNLNKIIIVACIIATAFILKDLIYYYIAKDKFDLNTSIFLLIFYIAFSTFISFFLLYI